MAGCYHPDDALIREELKRRGDFCRAKATVLCHHYHGFIFALNHCTVVRGKRKKVWSPFEELSFRTFKIKL
jgi:hypothetical protein